MFALSSQRAESDREVENCNASNRVGEEGVAFNRVKQSPPAAPSHFQIRQSVRCFLKTVSHAEATLSAASVEVVSVVPSSPP